MALRNASTNHATTEAKPNYLIIYNIFIAHYIKLISAAVHSTIQAKPFKPTVIEHNARNYYSTIMLNKYQANAANTDS